MPNIGGLGNIVITNPSTNVGGLGSVTPQPSTPSPTQTILYPNTPPPEYDHGKLKGLDDDDHPQYLRKNEAAGIYQQKIYIGPTPPVNPELGLIWFQT